MCFRIANLSIISPAGSGGIFYRCNANCASHARLARGTVGSAISFPQRWRRVQLGNRNGTVKVELMGIAMTYDPKEKDEFVLRYRKELSPPDDIAQLVLNGHLQIEAQLDEVLKAIFFHPDQMLDARLSFAQKMQVARAHAMRHVDDLQWDIIHTFNRLRNEIAHGGENKKRSARIEELRKLLLAGGKDEFREQVRRSNQAHVVVRGALVSTGYLLHYKDGLISLRRHIDELDARLNPEKERIPIQAQIDKEE
jgi:hypothetical protein